MLPDTVLKIANIVGYEWLLQPELKAIKDGLIFEKKKFLDANCWILKYRGYLNEKGQRQGVGMEINSNVIMTG
jgi:hypothetical protein